MSATLKIPVRRGPMPMLKKSRTAPKWTRSIEVAEPAADDRGDRRDLGLVESACPSASGRAAARSDAADPDDEEPESRRRPRLVSPG